MMTRYRFDASQSQFTAQALAAGPTFAVRDFAGRVRFEGGAVAGLRLDLLVEADSLELTDPVSAADRHETEETLRRDVLEVPRYPQVFYEAAGASADLIAQGRYRLRLDGRLSLHGVTRPEAVGAELIVSDEGIRLRGEWSLRLSDYQIRPAKALSDTVRLAFDLAAVPEE